MKKLSVNFLLAMILLLMVSCNDKTGTKAAQNIAPVSKSPVNADYSWHKLSWNAMYTDINLTLFTDELTRQKTQDSLKKFFEDYTEATKTGSALDSAVFNAKSGDTVVMDSLIWSLFAYGQKQFDSTGGLFNVGVGNLLRTWGFLWGQEKRVPSAAELKKETAKIKNLFYDTLAPFNSDSKTRVYAIKIKQTGMRFAIGGFSEGFGIQKASELLEKNGISRYLIEIGGNVTFSGKNTKDSCWRIGVEDANSPDQFTGVMQLCDEAFKSVSSSGGYQKYFVGSDGKKHHHILNPITGESAQGIKSVTVFTRDARTADLYSTYLFLLGIKKAKEVLGQHTDVFAIIHTEGDSLYISKKLRPFLQTSGAYPEGDLP